MSYNSFLKLIDSGLDPEEILSFISKSAPGLAKKISKLIIGGNSAQDILSFLKSDKEAVNFKPSNLQGANPAQISKLLSFQSRLNGPESQDEIDKQALQNFSKTALNVGTSLGGGLLASKALQGAPKIAQQIGSAISGRGIPKTPKQTALAPIEEAFQSTQTPEAPGTIAPGIETQQAQEGANNLIEQMNLGSNIKTMFQAGNKPEDIAAIISQRIMTPSQKTWLKGQTGKPIEELVQEYISNLPKEEEKHNEASKKLVALPNGEVGNLIEERQGIGSIELPDGKIRRQKMDDLHLEPEEIINAVHDLLKIPEAERSSVIAHTSYNPNSKKLYIMYHNGETVEYDDVEEDTFSAISHGKHTTKTTGGNIYGVFSPEDIEKSRGASFHNMIRLNPKYAKENEGKTWRYLQRGYDYYKGLRKQPKKRKKTSDD